MEKAKGEGRSDCGTVTGGLREGVTTPRSAEDGGTKMSALSTKPWRVPNQTWHQSPSCPQTCLAALYPTGGTDPYRSISHPEAEPAQSV